MVSHILDTHTLHSISTKHHTAHFPCLFLRQWLIWYFVVFPVLWLVSSLGSSSLPECKYKPVILIVIHWGTTVNKIHPCRLIKYLLCEGHSPKRDPCPDRAWSRAGEYVPAPFPPPLLSNNRRWIPYLVSSLNSFQAPFLHIVSACWTNLFQFSQTQIIIPPSSAPFSLFLILMTLPS